MSEQPMGEAAMSEDQRPTPAHDAAHAAPPVGSYPVPDMDVATLDMLRGIVGNGLTAVLATARIDDGGINQGDVVHLCKTDDGRYWVCETCEAYGPVEWYSPAKLVDDRPPARRGEPPLVSTGPDSVGLAPGVWVIADLSGVQDAAQEWHASL